MKEAIKYDYKRAAEKWVNEFNAHPTDMINTLMNTDIFLSHFDSWNEITKPSTGINVYVNENGETGEITDIIKTEDGRKYKIKLHGTEDTITCNEEDFELCYNERMPMWGTMWSFGSFLDNDWLAEEENQYIMSQCGFRIYEHDEWGYFFGIDGAGYDFFESHWIPLYKARGLEWHLYNKEYQIRDANNIPHKKAKKCLFYRFDEFTKLIKELFGEETEVESFLEGSGVTVYLNDEDISDDDITEKLSKHFKVKVTSFHTDCYDDPGIWVVYKED